MGGLLARPLKTHRVMLSPGERAEIVVSVRPPERIVLRSYPMDLGTDFWNQRFSGGDDSLDILQLRTADSLTPSRAIPQVLAATPDPGTDDAVKTREFRLGGTSINGQKMDMTQIDETVTLGDTELWRVSNVAGTPHNFHVHGSSSRSLTMQGQFRRASSRLEGHRPHRAGYFDDAPHAVRRVCRPRLPRTCSTATFSPMRTAG
jgi:FtsP/CotA-like multicopper oxidase with cupredoxin domain